jgi:hypothetical protein
MAFRQISIAASVRAATPSDALMMGVAASDHLAETFNDNGSFKPGVIALASARPRKAKKAQRPTLVGARVYVLTWGGGDEPESPAITVHRTKTGALKCASGYLDEVGDDFEPGDKTRLLRELRTTGSCFEGMGNETWLNLEEQAIED